ncbi:MAG TPA: hypothetical protein VGB56_12375, partial [Flavisolibacter sp.]
MKRNQLILATVSLGLVITLVVSCVKDPAVRQVAPPLPVTPPASFVEEFTNVSALSSKGWILKNLSN